MSNFLRSMYKMSLQSHFISYFIKISLINKDPHKGNDTVRQCCCTKTNLDAWIDEGNFVYSFLFYLNLYEYFIEEK